MSLTILSAPAQRSLAGNVNEMVVRTNAHSGTTGGNGFGLSLVLEGLPAEEQQFSLEWPALGYPIVFTVGDTTGAGSGTTLPKPDGETVAQYADKVAACMRQVYDIDLCFMVTRDTEMGNEIIKVVYRVEGTINPPGGTLHFPGNDYFITYLSIGDTSFPLSDFGQSIHTYVYPENHRVCVEVWRTLGVWRKNSGDHEYSYYYQRVATLSGVPDKSKIYGDDEWRKVSFDINEVARALETRPPVRVPCLASIYAGDALFKFALKVYEVYGNPPRVQTLVQWVDPDETADEWVIAPESGYGGAFWTLPGGVSRQNYYRNFLNDYILEAKPKRFLTIDNYRESNSVLDAGTDIRVSEDSPAIFSLMTTAKPEGIDPGLVRVFVKFYYKNNTVSDWIFLNAYYAYYDYMLHSFWLGWHNVKTVVPDATPEVVRYAISISIDEEDEPDGDAALTFVLDRRAKVDENYIMYLNDLGVWEVMSFFGNKVQGATVEREYVRQALGPGYNTGYNDLITIRNTWKDKREISTDLVTPGEKRQVLSVLRSKETYLYFGSTEPDAENTSAGEAYGRWVRCYVDAEEAQLYGSLDRLTGATITLYVGDEQEGGYAPQNGYVNLNQ